MDSQEEKDMEYQLTTANFEEEVRKAQLPVLVDFYADWCGPCKMLAPIVEKISDQYEGKLKVGKCNVDENMPLAQKYQVLNIPTLIIFKQGQPVKTIVGLQPMEELQKVIEEILESK